eukprot:1160117-Pelagomonas_calceolata.AAC.3
MKKIPGHRQTSSCFIDMFETASCFGMVRLSMCMLALHLLWISMHTCLPVHAYTAGHRAPCFAAAAVVMEVACMAARPTHTHTEMIFSASGEISISPTGPPLFQFWYKCSHAAKCADIWQQKSGALSMWRCYSSAQQSIQNPQFITCERRPTTGVVVQVGSRGGITLLGKNKSLTCLKDLWA